MPFSEQDALLHSLKFSQARESLTLTAIQLTGERFIPGLNHQSDCSCITVWSLCMSQKSGKVHRVSCIKTDNREE